MDCLCILVLLAVRRLFSIIKPLKKKITKTYISPTLCKSFMAYDIGLDVKSSVHDAITILHLCQAWQA